jgi:hypothetical protein
MGVLAPGSAHARPSARPPIDMRGNFPAHMSAESPFENNPLCPPKYSIVQGVGGGSPIIFRVWDPHIFVTWGLMPSVGTIGQLLKLPPLSCAPKYSIVRG